MLQTIVRPMCYAQLFLMRQFPRGTYVFADHERLTARDLDRLAKLCSQLENARGFQLLNHPARTLGRLPLLKRLRQTGINQFDAYRLSDHPQPKHFPVFIRGEDDHKGPLSTLIHTQQQLDHAYRTWDQRWGRTHRKLVVEHCDIGDENGVYRKYAAFRIGNRILPRHLFFSRHWCVKSWELLDEDLLAEERQYIDDFPHHDQLLQIFELAGVDFGRIDYGVKEGMLQVWEINTNPMLPVDYGGGGEARQSLHDAFNQRFIDAMRALEDGLTDDTPLRLDRTIPIWAAPQIAAEMIYRRALRGTRKRAG